MKKDGCFEVITKVITPNETFESFCPIDIGIYVDSKDGVPSNPQEADREVCTIAAAVSSNVNINLSQLIPTQMIITPLNEGLIHCVLISFLVPYELLKNALYGEGSGRTNIYLKDWPTDEIGLDAVRFGRLCNLNIYYTQSPIGKMVATLGSKNFELKIYGPEETKDCLKNSLNKSGKLFGRILDEEI